MISLKIKAHAWQLLMHVSVYTVLPGLVHNKYTNDVENYLFISRISLAMALQTYSQKYMYM